MNKLIQELFGVQDGWVIYRITVGLGTLFLGLAALLGVSYIRKIVILLDIISKK